MADYAAIYQQQPEAYDRMVAAEDCDGKLAQLLLAQLPTKGHIADIGIGTGRVARILLPAGAHIVGIDPAAPMLAVCRQRLAAFPPERWTLHQADARALPLADDSVQAAVAGWAFGHLRHWESDWQGAIGAAIAEMARVTQSQGKLVIIETLGTGQDEAAPPNDELAEYYRWLESSHGFTRHTIATDYAFDSVASAIEHMQFFFGDKLTERIKQRNWSRVPEWTGVWIRS